MFHPTLSKSGRFFFAPLIKLCEYMGNHFPIALLKIRYWYVFRKPLNLKCPQDLNEKIIWAKLFSDTTRWTELADKYKVRQYVQDRGLGETLVNLYAVWYKREEVDFDVLPEKFIIKANNGDGKGTNKIIHKAELTPAKKAAYIEIIDQWLHRKNIGALHAEPHYKNIVPCVIAEEVLPLEAKETSLTDYKMWCFNGKCHYILVFNNRNIEGNSAHIMIYDVDWNPHPEFCIFNSEYPQGIPISRPNNLQKMINIAEMLSKDFPELRVDLYNIQGKIYFGELTFTAQGGFMDNYKSEFLKKLGDKVNIEDFPRKKHHSNFEK